MTICLPVPSRNPKTHQDFVSGRINHPSPDEQTPTNEPQGILVRQLGYGLGMPKRILNYDAWTLVEREISRGIARTRLHEVSLPYLRDLLVLGMQRAKGALTQANHAQSAHRERNKNQLLLFRLAVKAEITFEVYIGIPSSGYLLHDLPFRIITMVAEVDHLNAVLAHSMCGDNDVISTCNTFKNAHRIVCRHARNDTASSFRSSTFKNEK